MSNVISQLRNTTETSKLYKLRMFLASDIFCALVGVIGNLYMGKLNYPSIAKAAKSNSGSLIPALSTMVVSTVPPCIR